MRRWRILGCIGAGVTLLGCMVPEARYRQVQTRLHDEQVMLRQTRLDLRAARQQLHRAEAAVRERDRALETAEQSLAQLRLDVSVVSREREQAIMLVDQLRSELERVGEHLTAFSEQKTVVSQALADAEARLARLTEVERSLRLRALLVRDLSLALYERVASGEYQLGVNDGRVELQVPADRVFASGAGELHPEAAQLLDALARVAKRHGATRISVTETGGQPRPEPEAAVRLKRVSDGLVAQGVGAEDVTIDVPSPSASAAPPTIRFAISTAT